MPEFIDSQSQKAAIANRMDRSAMELRRAILTAKRLRDTILTLNIVIAAKSTAQAPSRIPPAQPKQSYRVQEVAERWSKSPDFVRDYFRRVPGILAFDRPATRSKHRYLSLTIPEDVLLREETRLRLG
jgi:hypothetical protein